MTMRHDEAVVAARDPAWAHANVIRLTSTDAVAAFLADVAGP